MRETTDPRLAAAEFLFNLLDDIDTAEDMAKSDDAAFRKIVHILHRRRFEVADTDGYKVTFKELNAGNKVEPLHTSSEIGHG